MRPRRCRAVQLALMLLHERRLGDASQVAGYVRQLPRNFSTPLHWSPSQREQLQYPYLQAQVRLPWRQLLWCSGGTQRVCGLR